MLTRLIISLSFLLLMPLICQAQLPNPDYYTLFQITGGPGQTRVIDSAGSVLHTWNSNISAVSGTAAYLREDGLLLRSGQRGFAGGFLPGSWSTVQLVEMDGTVVWEYTQQVAGQLTFHHDLKPMRNGNILVTVWEFLSVAEMEALGWQPVNGVNGVWMEKIQELEPNLLDGSTTVVWEWALENHLAQDLDANRPNFANVGAERGRVDINFNASITSGDYFHISGIDYSEERDEIVLCPNNIDELWVIDHSTTTAEAATSTGGARGQGGEIIYRWGNPQVYDFRNGSTEPRFLGGAHDPRWCVDPDSGEIQLTVHNNNRVDNTPQIVDSQVLLLDLPLNESGDYVINNAETFLPEAPEVLYELDPADPFFSTRIMGSAQRLSNENILITLALSRTLVEVNQAGEIVWQETINDGGSFIFKSQNYTVSYPGFQGILSPLVAGDFNRDGVVNCVDLDGYIDGLNHTAVGALAALDVDGNNEISMSDAITHIENLVTTSNGVVGTIQGDFNCDGTVDVLGDAFTLVGNLGSTVISYSQGDADFNGFVNVLDDAFILVGNLGVSNQ